MSVTAITENDVSYERTRLDERTITLKCVTSLPTYVIRWWDLWVRFTCIIVIGWGTGCHWRASMFCCIPPARLRICKIIIMCINVTVSSATIRYPENRGHPVYQRRSCMSGCSCLVSWTFCPSLLSHGIAFSSWLHRLTVLQPIHVMHFHLRLRWVQVTYYKLQWKKDKKFVYKGAQMWNTMKSIELKWLHQGWRSIQLLQA